MQGLEWPILLFAGAILLFGGSQIPKIAKALGRAKGEYIKGKRDFDKEMKDTLDPKRPKTQKRKVYTVARELGIDTKGKSEAKLKKMIVEAMSKD